MENVFMYMLRKHAAARHSLLEDISIEIHKSTQDKTPVKKWLSGET